MERIGEKTVPVSGAASGGEDTALDTQPDNVEKAASSSAATLFPRLDRRRYGARAFTLRRAAS